MPAASGTKQDLYAAQEHGGDGDQDSCDAFFIVLSSSSVRQT
jgi:hypothetical protein